MNEFEEHLTQCKDYQRIISETIQLENYIFRKTPPVCPNKKIDINLVEEE